MMAVHNAAPLYHNFRRRGSMLLAVRNAQDIITPHIRDSHVLDYPCLKPGFMCDLELPRWAPLHLGPITLDMSPTKHVVWLGIAAIVCLIALLSAARAHQRTAVSGN